MRQSGLPFGRRPADFAPGYLFYGDRAGGRLLLIRKREAQDFGGRAGVWTAFYDKHA